MDCLALQVNKSHSPKKAPENNYLRKSPLAYRSFQPASVKYHKVYPRPEEHGDYDITSYDSEYGGVVSNFTSSIYDDNPPLYPNPEVVASRSNQANLQVFENQIPEIAEPDLPDDSLADADLKEHNIIDSVTYLYGFSNCHSSRTDWIFLLYIAGCISMIIVGIAAIWLIWSGYAKEFREHSKLYPVCMNLACCFIACNIIYMEAMMGVSSPSHCEKIALLLHYTYLVCSLWIILLAAAVTDYTLNNNILSLKFNYLIAYGVPAIYVMFNYAISIEQYEIKHYCWMSIEKGMVLGFMVPAMMLILMNTGLIIVGLQSVNEKQALLLTAKIQELVDHHISNWPKNEEGQLAKSGSVDTLDIYSAGSSRKNTDSSDTFEKEYNLSEDDCHYVTVGQSNGEHCEGNEPCDADKSAHEKSLLNMLYMDNLSWKSSWNTESNDLKTYLNLCLVLEPFFAINWVMGVVAIENVNHWSTPTIYLILITLMHAYFAVTISLTLPILKCNKETESCCEDIEAAPTVATRTTDSIPLLDSTIQQANITPAPADTISTISI